MSLRINTNLPSMTALRNLTTTNDQMAQSIGRLSTGLRINSAADDPAGLIISEGMRSQIKGVGQAIVNSQNAINMSKTADAAMSEVQTLLTNIRAIAVHAANTAVVDSAQLQADQMEIKSTILSVNRIASSTQWGNKNLLDGTAGVTANLTNITNVSGSYFGSTFGGQSIANGNLTIQRTVAATQTSLTTDRAFAGSTSVAPAGSFVINGYTFTSNGVSDTLQTMVDKVNQQSANTGVTASIITSGGVSSMKLTSVEYGSQFPINYFDASNVMNSTANPAPTVAGTDAQANVTVTVNTTSGTTTSTHVFRGGQGSDTSGLRLTDTEGNSISLTPAGNTGMTTASSVGVITAGNVRFQIGPNAQQGISFGLPDVRSTQLGTAAFAGESIDTLDVTTQAGATRAMSIIDNAVEQLSQMRGNLGSFQKNFLESTVRSLNVANENITAAESTIRDADVAAEMTQYTKIQVLQQSGMAVLAQANQAPQQILKLLQS